MTRFELLQLLVARARAHGFEFRRWYTHQLGLPWINAEAALKLLDTQRRYYTLIFSHEFAQAFWAPGSDIFLELPARTFESVMPDGTIRSIARKQHMRRSARRDAWKYHLKQMALAEQPLRYLRRFLPIEDQLDPDPETIARNTGKKVRKSVRGPRANSKPGKPPLAELPPFLQKPYNNNLQTVSKAEVPGGQDIPV